MSKIAFLRGETFFEIGHIGDKNHKFNADFKNASLS
jgi:hypothetical protein